MPNYPNLAGFRGILRDGNLAYDAPEPVRPFILVIGTAYDGPVNEPVLVDSDSGVNELFGGTSQGTLIKKVIETDQGGGTVFACRTGDPQLASLDVQGDGSLLLTGRYPGEGYNNVQVTVTAGGIMTIRNHKTLEEVSFTLANYGTNGDLVGAINNSTIINTVIIATTDAPSAAPTAGAVAATTLAGGTSDALMTYDALFTALSDTLTQLEDFDANIIVVAGAHVDATRTATISGNPTEINAGFGDLVAAFCADANANGVARMIGVLGVSGAGGTEYATKHAYINRLVALSCYPSGGEPANNFYVDAATTPDVKGVCDFRPRTGNDDYGKYVSVVAGEANLSNRLGSYAEVGDGVYAGLVSTLGPSHGATAKPVPQARSLRYRVTMTEANNLLGCGYVPFVRHSGDIIVQKDILPTHAGSDYRLLTTTRICLSVVEAIMVRGRKFLGEPINAANYNAMATMVERIIAEHIAEGALNNARPDEAFNIVVTPRMQVLGQAEVQLTLRPAFELTDITVSTSLATGSVSFQATA